MFSYKNILTVDNIELLPIDHGEKAPSFPPSESCLKSVVDFTGYNSMYNFYVREKKEDSLCSICYTNIANRDRFNCIHSFCISCTNTWLDTCIQNGNNINCPMCRASLSR